MQWRHDAWELLNRLGRREEASDQALALCRAGIATDPQLHSLIRRSESFPIALPEGDDPEKLFDNGLGMARWYFTQQDFDKAREALRAEMREDRPGRPAALALQGRLLAETQSIEEIPAWHAQCDERTERFANYWAALGTYFFDLRQYEASARALLEAVYRDPTDRVAFQRLSKVFGSIDRPDEGQQFRFRGIKIYETERMSSKLLESGDPVHRRDIARHLKLLDRPFELLQWTESVAPRATSQQKSDQLRAQIANQRSALLGVPESFTLASQSALIGLSRDDYDLTKAMESLIRSADRMRAPLRRDRIETLAKPSFVDVASAAGLQFQWYKDVEVDFDSIPIHESIGGGIAVVDYDMDGWPDLYLAQGSGDPPSERCTRSSELFRNHEGKFVARTEASHTEDFNYSSGLSAGDVNQDGFPDLYLGALGRNRLLINNGDGTFRDATDGMGQFPDRFSTSLAIADINGDAIPDLFESNYIMMDGAFALPRQGPDGKPILPGPLDHVADFDRWFENLGDGSFGVYDVREEVSEKPGTSLGVIITDFDGDGSNEVFVGNDMRPNHYLQHAGGNRLVNVADARGVANGFQGIPNGCMGIAAADFNRDGSLDMHVTNFIGESNNLFLQTSVGAFTDFAIRYGIEQTSSPMVGFGTKAIDVDRNGWTDLLATNGHIFDTSRIGRTDEAFRMPPQLMVNHGRTFESVEVEGGYWASAYLGRAMASVDYNRDGRIDVVISHLDRPVALLENRTVTPGQSIQLELVGTVSERDAIGTRVVVNAAGQEFSGWVTGGDGYFASDEPVIELGLGNVRSIDSVQVFWPSGARQEFDGLEVGSRYLIVEGREDPLKR